ncbi:protein starmaker-like [Argopecten irradians]|uniref:protein starmaker-like n=1 Tax=Argopecten irradians TaxID=31199 RepID=UPI0037166CAD
MRRLHKMHSDSWAMISSIFSARVTQPNEEMVNCLQDALQNMILQESDIFNRTKQTLDKEEKEKAYTKNVESRGKICHHFSDKTEDKVAENNNKIVTYNKTEDVNIKMNAIDDISQESNVPNMQDVILSINNSANGNSFQCFPDEKNAVSDHPTTKAENYDKILKKNTEAVVQDKKDTSENETDDFGKCTNSPTNTNCSANGQDCPSGQKEEPEKHDDKVMKAGNSSESDVDAGTVDPPVGDSKDQDISDDKGSEVSFKTQTNSEDLKTGETQQLHTEESTIKDNEPSGNDIADSTEDSTNEKDIFIAVDSEITFKHQTEGAEAELKMEEKEQSQKDGNSQTQVIEKTNTVVESIEAYVGNGFARIEKALSTTDIKRIQEDSTNADNQISHEGRKPSGKSTTVLRISVKDINNEFDSINTESNIFGKSDLEEKKDLEVNNDVDSKHSQSQENIVHAKDDEREESEEKLSLKDLAYGNEGYKHFKLYAEVH